MTCSATLPSAPAVARVTNAAPQPGADHPISENPVATYVGAGQSLTCTFTNEQDASITVEKEVIGVEGDTTGFAARINIQGRRYRGHQHPDGRGRRRPSTTAVPAGEYEVRERFAGGPEPVPPDGYADARPRRRRFRASPARRPRQVTVEGDGMAEARDAAVSVPAGGDVKVCFYNEPLGSITIEKVTVGDVDGTFPFESSLADFELGANGTRVFEDLGAGDYNITEVVPEGWNLVDITCEGAGAVGTESSELNVLAQQSFYGVDGSTVNITLDTGDDVTCTFTNEPHGTVIVEKVNNTEAGGPFDFVVNRDGSEYAPLTAATARSSSTSRRPSAPTPPKSSASTARQRVPNPRARSTRRRTTASWSSISPARSSTFTFINEDCPALAGSGNLVVEKFSDFNGNGAIDGDDAGLEGWEFTITGPQWPTGETFTTNADGEIFHPGITAGTYTVSETMQSGWEPTGLMIDGVSQTVSTTAVVTIEHSDDEPTVTVTFNNQPLGDLRVEKTTLENGNEIDEQDGWTITVTGCGYHEVMTTDADGVAEFTDVPVCDDITVQEDPDSKPDFAATSGTSRDSAVQAGETTVETFTNERITVTMTPTPTPTSTPETETPTPETETPTPEDPTETPEPTETPTEDPTETPTNTPSATEDPSEVETPTNTPTATATTPVDDVAGEQTPGTGATPIAPDSGTGLAGGNGSFLRWRMVTAVLFISGGLAAMALGQRNR
ncbi:MAG: SpaA isopeptide-forming pilin-related protein [Dehalococcoidia bacterium]|nr:SpaA isopeptide-forming pilin-related protein [Dehalococcoidia bacterium]